MTASASRRATTEPMTDRDLDMFVGCARHLRERTGGLYAADWYAADVPRLVAALREARAELQALRDLIDGALV